MTVRVYDATINSHYPRSYYTKPFQPFVVSSDVSSYNGWRYTTSLNSHKGVDIPKLEGTAVNSISSGSVYNFVTDDPYRGKYVVVDTNTDNYYVVYQHLSKIETYIAPGYPVSKGITKLGEVGHTGLVFGSPGDHLHLETSTSPTSASNWVDALVFFG